MFQKEGQVQDFSSITITPEGHSTRKAQQSWQLPCNSISLFILLGFVFIFIGIVQLVAHYQSSSSEISLLLSDGVLRNIQPEYVSFSGGSKIALYVRIQNLTQYNNIDSEYPLYNYQKEDPSNIPCQDYSTNKQLNKNKAIDGTLLVPSERAIPCGLYAGMFPIGDITVSLDTGQSLTVESADLTYFEYDTENINPSKQWLDLSSHIWQSWGEHNALIRTTKLVAHLPASFSGLVNLTITLPSGTPQPLGTVTAILSTTKAFGTSNVAFCIMNILQSVFLFLFAFGIFFYNKLITRSLEHNRIDKINGYELELRSQPGPESVKSNQ